MELKLRVICPQASAPGFALAGLHTDAVADAQAARRQLDALVADPEVGVVLIDEQLHRQLPAELLQRLARKSRPLVIPFPGPRGAQPGWAEAALLDVLRRAIGYRVRLP